MASPVLRKLWLKLIGKGIIGKGTKGPDSPGARAHGNAGSALRHSRAAQVPAGGHVREAVREPAVEPLQGSPAEPSPARAPVDPLPAGDPENPLPLQEPARKPEHRRGTDVPRAAPGPATGPPQDKTPVRPPFQGRSDYSSSTILHPPVAPAREKYVFPFRRRISGGTAAPPPPAARDPRSGDGHGEGSREMPGGNNETMGPPGNDTGSRENSEPGGSRRSRTPNRARSRRRRAMRRHDQGRRRRAFRRRGSTKGRGNT